ncbi:asparagine synthase (glutamine-hydrolyzing) [Alcaligenaceae bacterium CGII-47]|nr:asparagine synthase (glutamine-hydrolyzing) [Alcaligenaceae bacterium CGII-47]
MCGLAGFLDVGARSTGQAEAVLRRMGAALTHRGPDDSGLWFDPAAGVGLAHQRLSIADLSAAGHQPMHSACGRYVLSFNGEIYNYQALRSQLDSEAGGIPWRGHSDTEVLLACLVRWGTTKTLNALVGMFAYACWDRQDRVLTLARDRMGEKPLYWGWQGNVLLFGSELKALKMHPACRAEVDRGSLALLLRYNYIPAPHSIYKSIFKLQAGHAVSISVDGAQQCAQPEPYWTLRGAVQSGLAHPFAGTDGQAVDELESRLSASIQAQMVADVPLGAFLSGGVDSSTVVALMQKQSTRPVCTYAIGFEDKAFNEAEYAGAVARHLGTDHTELYVSSQDALAVVPQLPRIYCEPFADSSQIPTVLVSRLARQHVTVALSGDGGDELFGGYALYQLMPRVWNRLRLLPMPLRRILAGVLAMLPISQRLEKLQGIMAARSREELYGLVRSHWLKPESLVLYAQEPSSLLRDAQAWRFIDDYESWLMAVDTCDYMVDDILVKVDRAAMASSLETRVPILDHRIVEFASSLPLAMKIRGGVGKWILREVLYRHVPKALIDRPKRGFAVPLASWLRGPLREWAEALLNEQRLRTEGYFDVSMVRRTWTEHLSGRRNRATKLWAILMFQAWLAEQ